MEWSSPAISDGNLVICAGTVCMLLHIPFLTLTSGTREAVCHPVNVSLIPLGLPRPILFFNMEDAQITLLHIF